MARVNVYLPDDLAEEVRAADLNVSKIAQEALTTELRRRRTKEWWARIDRLKPIEIPHEEVLKALDEAREEFGA